MQHRRLHLLRKAAWVQECDATAAEKLKNAGNPMKKLFIIAALLLVYNALTAQYTLRLVVTDVATKNLDDMYVAGSFNNWNPRDPNFKLKPFGASRRAIVIDNLPAGPVSFKFTRGSFDKVETAANGADIPNRNIDLSADASLNFSIAGWKDDFPDKPKPNTATAQVSIIDTAFAIPQLGRSRRIWVYLPKSYQKSKLSYPVLYMHDGQNLFNEQTAPYGEWGIDETLDSLQATTKKECIVVGIDHGGDKRMQEYNPFNHPQFGPGEGEAYARFVVETLKPYIDKNYRTQKGPQQTFVAGSSMGGLISLYIQLRYPNVFGGAGVFSPAFWTAPQIYSLADSLGQSATVKKLFFYAGGQESREMIPDMDKMIAVVQKQRNYDVMRLVEPLNKHNEAAWRKVFPIFWAFLMK